MLPKAMGVISGANASLLPRAGPGPPRGARYPGTGARHTAPYGQLQPGPVSSGSTGVPGCWRTFLAGYNS